MNGPEIIKKQWIRGFAINNRRSADALLGMKKKSRFRVVLLFSALALLVGCSTAPKPFTYEPNTEIKEGPGLFTGQKGEFVLFSSPPKTAEGSVPAAPTARDTDIAPSATEEAEFRQFQEWKKEQQELEQFKSWKQSPQGQKEYQEFQEWKRWKEYQKWREAHPEGK